MTITGLMFDPAEREWYFKDGAHHCRKIDIEELASTVNGNALHRARTNALRWVEVKPAEIKP